MDIPAYDQRLGKRRDLDAPIEATWPIARKARLRTRVNQETVRIVNVSPTGVGLVASTVPGFVVGSRTRLQLPADDCDVTVRRIQHVDSEITYYGVRFVDPDPAFVDLLLELAGAPPREKMESYWNNAE